MSSTIKENVIREFVPDDMILKFDKAKLSSLAISQYNRLVCKLKIELSRRCGEKNSERYYFAINQLLIHEHAVIETI